jgi:phospholipid-binding lipoprotein MlaA
LGLGGLIDIATPMQLERPNEDFGQTLGVWGVGPGAYIVWPILGPSTVRDSISLPGDMYFSASSVGTYPREKNLLLAWQAVNTRANLLDAGNLLDDVALDKYSFMRDGYLQRRESLIHDGRSSEDDEPEDTERYDLPEKNVPPAAPAPASAPASSVSAAGMPEALASQVPAATAPLQPGRPEAQMVTFPFHARTPSSCDAADAGAGLSSGTSIAALRVQTRFLKGSPCLPPTNSL